MVSLTLTLLVANLAGRVRKDRLHGREYLVAPATLIVPGVLNGSQGPLYYPPDETARDPWSWNGMPLVMWHPTDSNGNHVSGRSPTVANEKQIGILYNVRYDGKLTGEAWFDEKLTQAADQKFKTNVYQRLITGQPIELSTGLFTDNVPAPRDYRDHTGAVYNGLIARNYRPDHLAVLPDQRGACSVQDGCGINVNEERDFLDEILDNARLSGGHWVTTEDGNRLYIKDGEPVAGNPHVVKAAKGGKKKGKKEEESDEDDERRYQETSDRTDRRARKEAIRDLLRKHTFGDVFDHPEFGKVKLTEDGLEPVRNEADDYTESLLAELTEAGLLGVNVLGQVKSKVTGHFKRWGSGYGKGPEHEAAQKGSMTLTERDRELGARAKKEYEETGHNPPSWAKDEAKWDKAKRIVEEKMPDCDDTWACVAYIYEHLGGVVGNIATTENAFCPTGAGGGVDPTCSPSGGSGGGKGGGKGESHKDAVDRTQKEMDDLNKQLRSETDDDKREEILSQIRGVRQEHDEARRRYEKDPDGGERVSGSGGGGGLSKPQAKEAGQLRKFAEKKGVNPDTATDEEIADLARKYSREQFQTYTPDKFREVLRRGTNNSSNPNAEADMNRDQKITFLTANCECWNGKEKVLGNTEIFSDQFLDHLVKEVREREQMKAQHQNTVEVFNHLRAELDIPAEVAITANALPPFMTKGKPGKKAKKGGNPRGYGGVTKNEGKCPECGGAMVDGVCEKCGYDAEEEEEPAVENQAKIETNLAKSMGFESVGHMKATLNVAKEVEQAERRRLCRLLTANISDPDRKKKRFQALMQKPLPDLRERLEDMPAPSQQAEEPTGNGEAYFPSYYGAAGGPSSSPYSLTDNESKEVLDLESARRGYDPVLTKNKTAN